MEYQSPEKDQNEDYEFYEESPDGNEEGSQLNSSEFKSKLLVSKMATKEIENEAKALANRINFLEQEEQRVLKKIEETRNKAINIIDIKKRNIEKAEIKKKFSKKKEREIAAKNREIQEKRNKMRQKLEETKQGTLAQSHAKAKDIKNKLKVKNLLIIRN